MVNAIGHSRLGFGCANLPGKLTRTEAVALVEAALDAGVRHIDVARMYGDGAAEGIVGVVAQRRRDEMILITKAGIAPASGSLPARALRRVMRAAPRLEPVVPSSMRQAALAQFGQFAPDQIMSSLETSLRALNTDHVDALLLHECDAANVTDDLKRVLERARDAGKILRWGIASSGAATSAMISKHPDLCDIVQFEAAAEVKPPPAAQLIVHSVLGVRLKRFMHRAHTDAAFAAQLSAQCELAAHDRTGAAALLMARELKRRPGTVVLFSTTSLTHIRRNAELLDGPPLPLDAFEALLAEVA